MNRNSTRYAKILGSIICSIAMLGSFAACGSGAPSSSSASGNSKKILVIPKYTGLKYFDVSGDGAKEEGKKLGVDVEYIGSQDATANAQIQTITNAIAQHPAAMVVSAIDENAVTPILKKAQQQGIKVVTYDADANSSARSIFVNQLSYELAAKTMLDSALKNDPSGGLVAFISASPSATNHRKHVELMKKLIDTDPAYSKLKYVDTVQYSQDDATKSEEISRNLMQAHPDLKFIISSSVPTTAAAANAIENAGKQGQVFAPGFSMPSSMSHFVEDGTIKAFCLWDPAQLGAVSVAVAQQLVDGKITGKKGETVKVDGVGEFTIGDNGELNVDKPLTFTKENISEYKF